MNARRSIATAIGLLVSLSMIGCKLLGLVEPSDEAEPASHVTPPAENEPEEESEAETEEQEPTGPRRRFAKVAVGESFVCGLTEDKTLLCRGRNDMGQSTPPGGDACWLDSRGYITCHDANRDEEIGPPPATYARVEAGDGHACAIRDDGRVECWGDNSFGQTEAPDGPFTDIATGWRHNCAIRPDGTVECWGFGSKPERDEGDWHDDYNQAIPPSGTFKAIAAGATHTCAVQSDGWPECWGGGNNGETNAPATKLESLTARKWHTCGLTSDNRAICWGLGSDPNRKEGKFDHDHDQSVPPDGTFLALATGYYLTCGIRPNNYVDCWGIGATSPHEPIIYNGEANPPPLRFSDIDSNNALTCGVTLDDGDIVCWGVVPTYMIDPLGPITTPS